MDNSAFRVCCHVLAHKRQPGSCTAYLSGMPFEVLIELCVRLWWECASVLCSCAQKGKVEYLVKWIGWEDTTWEPKELMEVTRPQPQPAEYAQS